MKLAYQFYIERNFSYAKFQDIIPQIKRIKRFSANPGHLLQICVIIVLTIVSDKFINKTR